MATPTKTDAQKQCKCRNTHCLTLRCRCFAAERNCTDCFCNGCSNQVGDEAKVEVARKQAEERNPYAFATKEEKLRNGYKCPKSMCTHNNCQCYKAEVGCQDQCKCAGCINPHGRKL